MKKYLIIGLGVLACVGLFSAGVAYSQFWASVAPPVSYWTKADIDALYKGLAKGKNDDQGAFIEDVGQYNIGFWTQHRETPEFGPPQHGMRFHSNETEIYYIISGTGTLVTQTGAMTNVEPSNFSHDSEYSRLTSDANIGNSPSGYATFSDPPVNHKVGPGDWVVVPPFTGHFLKDIDGHVDYVCIRIDPWHSLPAGYINPIYRKLGIKTFAVH